MYINLGEFYDSDAIRLKKDKIIAITDRRRAIFGKAYASLRAADSVTRDFTEHLYTPQVAEAVKKRAKGIIGREFKKNGGKKPVSPGRTVYRFLSAFTCSGTLCRYDTADTLASRIYVLDNDVGFASPFISILAEAATERGYDTILCPSHTRPEMYEHLIIPALSLAFVTNSGGMRYGGEFYRHIRLDAMSDNSERAQRRFLRARRKIASALQDDAREALSEAKTLHDKLEAVYNPYVDFAGVYALAEKYAEKIAANHP